MQGLHNDTFEGEQNGTVVCVLNTANETRLSQKTAPPQKKCFLFSRDFVMPAALS